MSYSSTIPLEYPVSAHALYEVLCDLSRYPEWNSGMLKLSDRGHLRPGLRYETVHDVLGQTNVSEVEVMAMVPDRQIILASRTGLIMFEATMSINPTSDTTCTRRPRRYR
jgi:hypothetical protein